jgi:hypothetical protein
LQDKEDMDEIIGEEREEEKDCLEVHSQKESISKGATIQGVKSRSGKKSEVEGRPMKVTEAREDSGGKDTTGSHPSQGPRYTINEGVPTMMGMDAVGKEAGPTGADPSPTSMTTTREGFGEGDA